MANHRQRGSDLRIRSEAKAAAADRLLLVAQEEAALFDAAKGHFEAIPAWRFRRRRATERRALLHAVRHMQAIRAAQDVAKKGRYVEL